MRSKESIFSKIPESPKKEIDPKIIADKFLSYFHGELKELFPQAALVTLINSVTTDIKLGKLAMSVLLTPEILKKLYKDSKANKEKIFDQLSALKIKDNEGHILTIFNTIAVALRTAMWSLKLYKNDSEDEFDEAVADTIVSLRRGIKESYTSAVYLFAKSTDPTFSVPKPTIYDLNLSKLVKEELEFNECKIKP